MPYQTATATDHNDALDQLSDFATSEGAIIAALSAVIGAGGSGYSIGDDIDLVGGSFIRAARFNVDSEGAASAVVNNGGTGGTYAVSDVLTLVGGTFTTASTFTVTAVSAGQVTGIGTDGPGPGNGLPTVAGDYTVTPGPTNIATTGGGGTGATLDLTFGAVATVSLLDHGVYSEIDGTGPPTSPAATAAVSPATGTGATLTPTYSPDIVAIGSGYAVNDVISVSGGTSTSGTTLLVTSVDGGGGVTGIKLLEHGGYTVEPTNTVATTVVPAGGTGLTLDLNYENNGWSVQRENQETVSSPPTVTAGGTGYTNGSTDVLTLVGGIDVKVPATFTATVSGGVVTSVVVLNSGDYGEVPANPAATTVSPAGGTGATLTVTYQRVTGTRGRDLILLGSAAGAPTIGIRSYTDTPSGADSWELRGMTAYSAANAWEAQPDICDGDNVAGEQGQYVPLDNGSLTYRFYVESASIRAVFKISTTFTNAYSGFLDRLGTQTEYPYPMLIMGCSSTHQRLFGSTVIGYRGMCDPISAAVGHNGPGRVRTPGGIWNVVKNSEDTGSGRSISQNTVIWPAGTPDPLDALLQDRGSTNAFEFTDIIPTTGNPGSPTMDMIQTADSPENSSSLILPVVVESSPILQMLGTMRGIRWLSARASPSSLVAEDTITDKGGNTWDVFQNCNATDQWAFFCVRREQ